MAKYLLVFAIMAALLFFGCASFQQQPSLGINAPPGTESNGNGAENGEGQVPAPDSPLPSSQEAVASKTRYLADFTVVQYSLKSRNRTTDELVDAYEIVFAVADVSGGADRSKPLANPEKARAKLAGPSGTITLKQGAITESDYSQLPNLMLWPAIPGYSDQSKTHFYYAKAGSLLAGGTYKLEFDADGDGTAEAEKELVVPGVKIANPAFGSKQSSGGFSITWEQVGKTQDFIYTISTGKGFAGLDSYLANAESVPGTSLAANAETIGYGGEIETGSYLLNFQLEGGELMGKDAQDYYVGKPEKETVFTSSLAKEFHLVLYNVGNFCHCDDAFLGRACTVDEINADPLC